MSNKLTKAFLSSILFASFISCGAFKKDKKVNNDLVGKLTIQKIIESEHKNWFNKELNTYVVDTETLSDFENNPDRLKKVSVKMFLGTWCSDSRREFPRFYNIMQFLNIEKYCSEIKSFSGIVSFLFCSV